MRTPEVASDVLVAIETEADIVSARARGRALAIQVGFTPTRATLLATAISELARNILLYAGRGEVLIALVENGTGTGIRVTAQDHGPGIADLGQALRDGYSTSGRMGLGLPGVRRLTDRFEVRSSSGQGTVVAATMWRH